MEEADVMERVSTRLPQELIVEVERLAEFERRPVSMMTRMLIEEALTARAKKAKKQ
jgi:predicted transcriptional regulator